MAGLAGWIIGAWSCPPTVAPCPRADIATESSHASAWPDAAAPPDSQPPEPPDETIADAAASPPREPPAPTVDPRCSLVEILGFAGPHIGVEAVRETFHPALSASVFEAYLS